MSAVHLCNINFILMAHNFRLYALYIGWTGISCVLTNFLGLITVSIKQELLKLSMPVSHLTKCPTENYAWTMIGLHFVREENRYLKHDRVSSMLVET